MLSTCNITVSTVNGDGTRQADELIRGANGVGSGDILRQLGTVIKGNRFECPICKAYPPSATFADDMGDSIKPSRWRCTSCDGGGSPVDLVGLVRGYNATDAARWILRLPPVEAELSPIGDVLPARGDIGQEPAQEITTSIDSANALENEVPAFVSSETRAEIEVMSDGSIRAAVRPRGSDERQELRLVSDHNGSSDSVDSVSNYVSIVLMDRKPREFRFIKPGRRGSKSWTWTPDKTPADFGRVLSAAQAKDYNAYVTINPLRADAVKVNKAQSDSDIERRTFIPVDVDPKRPSGTMATQTQTEAAKSVADQVIEWYRDNFPDYTEPLIGCSGSGYQILIPCDIPADDEGDEIVSGLLKLLARSFDSEDAHVDTAVANRSRIMRVCGTEAFYSDGSRFGQVVSHPTTHPTEWRVLTVDELRPIVPKKEPKQERTTAMIRAAMPTNGTPRSNMAKRLDAYIKPALAEITNAPDGTKHETLFKKTAHIANYVAGASLQSHEVEYKTRILDALRENAGHVGSWEAANTTIDDAWAKGITEPKPLPDREPPANPDAKNKPIVTVEFDGVPSGIIWPDEAPWTDKDRAAFVREMFDGKVLYCEQNESWMQYEGGRWVESRERAFRHAKRLPALLASIAEKAGQGSKPWYGAAWQASSISAVNSTLKWLETDLMIDINELDSDPWILNLKNGTYDLKNHVFRKHNPVDLLTKQSPVNYDKNAECPQFDATLEYFQPDPEMRELILQFGGYCLTGVVTDLYMPIWYGPLANNGKSTLSEALRCVLGPDYSTSLDVEFLIGDRRQGSDEYYYAQLKGMRHVLFEEPAEGATLRSKALKAIVDNRREFTGRHPHGRPFKFPLTWKSHVVTNHKPNVKATDAGTWRRLLMVPFNVTIDPKKDQKDFKNVLFSEGSGILNRLIAACQRWQKNGQLFVPKSVQSATDDFRSDSDVIGQFISEKCVTGSPEYKAKSGDLYRAYQSFMVDNPDLGEAQTTTAFGRYMGERFKKDTAKRYLGIGLMT